MGTDENERAGRIPYEQRHETIQFLDEAPAKRPEDIERAVQQILRRAKFLGYAPSPGHKMLDFGCGIGHSVGYLVTALNLDAHGVDVYEFWGSERQYYYEKSLPPAPEIAQRLHKLESPEYRIPFPSDSFDFVFSDQVFEHIADRRRAFRELQRVLKPGGLSLHIFPGPGKVREPHIGVPVIPLCRWKLYLSAWALIGFRTDRQKRLGWRQTLHANLDTMQYCHYPTEGKLIGEAAEVGVEIAFVQKDWLESAPGRAAKLIRAARWLGASSMLAGLLAPMAQRMMVISK